MSRSLPVLVALVVSVTGLAAARAQPAATPWNQEQVTALATQLRQSVGGLRDIARSELRAGQQMRSRGAYRLLDALRVIEREVQHLHKKLKGGGGREETAPVFGRIDELRREAADDAQKLLLSQELDAAIAAARDIWLKMAPFYEPA